MSDAPYWNLSSPEIFSEDENIGVNLTPERGGVNMDAEGAEVNLTPVRRLVNLTPGRRVVNLTPVRGSPLHKYMTSGSARRKQVKDINCVFCNEDFEGEELGNHLSNSELCRILYSRKLRIKASNKNVDSILVRLYTCFNCHLVRRLILTSHLKKNPLCLETYRRRFKLKEVADICKRIANLKKQSILSRQKLARTVEMSKCREKEVIKHLNKTVVTSLNEYNTNVELANYRLCISCHSNFSESLARVLKPEDDIDEVLLRRELRRLETFWLCKTCAEEPSGTMTAVVEASVDLNESVTNGVITFFPAKEEVTNEENINEIMETEITVFFPESINALTSYKGAGMIKSKRHLIRKMFETRSLDRADIAIMLENEIKKYQDVKKCASRFSAVVADNDKKVLKAVEELIDDSGITCSSNWFYRQKTSMQFRIDQFGSLCFLVKIKIPKLNLETIATALIAEGHTVTVEKVGLASGELLTKYLVHLDHMSDSDCTENCVRKMSLKDYLSIVLILLLLLLL